MKYKVIYEVWQSEGVILARQWQWRFPPNLAFFKTATWIRGRAKDVLIVSEELVLTPYECKELAIKLETGRFERFEFSLRDESPKWRKL